MTIIDHMTKRVHWVAMKEDTSAKQFAWIFIDKFVRLHRIPHKLFQTDTHGLYVTSGNTCGGHWYPNGLLAYYSTHKRTDKLRKEMTSVLLTSRLLPYNTLSLVTICSGSLNSHTTPQGTPTLTVHLLHAT